MKQFLLVFGLSFIFISVCTGGDKTHFRDAKWGMSRHDVKSCEKERIVYEGRSIIGAEDFVVGLKAKVVYIFFDELFTRGKYIFEEPHSNKNLYITDYNKVKKALTQKYGNPIKDDVFWVKKLYENDPQKHGFAVSLGHCGRFAQWTTPETKIILALYGDNYKIEHYAEYSSVTYKDLMENEDKRRSSEKL